MEFKTPEDERLIVATCALASQTVRECIEWALEKEGYLFEKKGKTWNEFYEIKRKDKTDMEVEFHLQHLYLEIATEDRDIRPLEWDRRLLDLSFLRKKMADVIYSKIRPLLTILSTDDPEEMDEELIKLAKDQNFDRLRIWRKEIKKEGGENKNG